MVLEAPDFLWVPQDMEYKLHWFHDAENLVMCIENLFDQVFRVVQIHHEHQADLPDLVVLEDTYFFRHIGTMPI